MAPDDVTALQLRFDEQEKWMRVELKELRMGNAETHLRLKTLELNQVDVAEAARTAKNLAATATEAAKNLVATAAEEARLKALHTERVAGRSDIVRWIVGFWGSDFAKFVLAIVTVVIGSQVYQR